MPGREPPRGIRPPIKVRETYVVEPAPSHDGAPCLAAWTRDDVLEAPEGWSLSDLPDFGRRPAWSIQVYDTTTTSKPEGGDDDDREHLGKLARELHEETREERHTHGRSAPDRLEVWGMPLPDDMPEDEKAARCKAHAVAEIASRDAAAATAAATSDDVGFPIPKVDVQERWQRGIVIVDRPRELWDEGEGGFLVAYWDSRPDYLEALAQEYGGRREEPDVSVFRYTRSELGALFGGLRDGIEAFYQNNCT